MSRRLARRRRRRHTMIAPVTKISAPLTPPLTPPASAVSLGVVATAVVSTVTDRSSASGRPSRARAALRAVGCIAFATAVALAGSPVAISAVMTRLAAAVRRRDCPVLSLVPTLRLRRTTRTANMQTHLRNTLNDDQVLGCTGGSRKGTRKGLLLICSEVLLEHRQRHHHLARGARSSVRPLCEN